MIGLEPLVRCVPVRLRSLKPQRLLMVLERFLSLALLAQRQRQRFMRAGTIRLEFDGFSEVTNGAAEITLRRPNPTEIEMRLGELRSSLQRLLKTLSGFVQFSLE